MYMTIITKTSFQIQYYGAGVIYCTMRRINLISGKSKFYHYKMVYVSAFLHSTQSGRKWSLICSMDAGNSVHSHLVTKEKCERGRAWRSPSQVGSRTKESSQEGKDKTPIQFLKLCLHDSPCHTQKTYFTNFHDAHKVN